MDMSCLPHDIRQEKTFLFELILKFWKAGWKENLNLRRMTSFDLQLIIKKNTKKVFHTIKNSIACVKVTPSANHCTVNGVSGPRRFWGISRVSIVKVYRSIGLKFCMWCSVGYINVHAKNQPSTCILKISLNFTKVPPCPPLRRWMKTIKKRLITALYEQIGVFWLEKWA